MKAINVKGISTLKHYPLESMTRQLGYLTEEQVNTLIDRQEILINRLARSVDLLKAAKLPPVTKTAIDPYSQYNKTIAAKNLKAMKRILATSEDLVGQFTLTFK